MSCVVLINAKQQEVHTTLMRWKGMAFQAAGVVSTVQGLTTFLATGKVMRLTTGLMLDFVTPSTPDPNHHWAGRAARQVVSLWLHGNCLETKATP